MAIYLNFFHLAYISFCILILYTAFMSASNLQTTIMEEDDYEELGYYILAVLYFFMGIGSLMSTGAINKLGTRGCLVLGGFGNVVWIASTILPAYKF
jgi:hypothetical protein